MKMMRYGRIAAILCLSTQLAFAGPIMAQQKKRAAGSAESGRHSFAQRDEELAARFAPVFYQALGEKPRSDYITNFDFDGDWRGDNNWTNAENPRFHLRAYIYFAVSETLTHIFIHYAVFHPQDYKGGEKSGALLSEILQEGIRRGGKYDPTGRADEAVLAHENDMEGCLVVVLKQGTDEQRARVVYVETLAHNRFLRYTPEGNAETARTSAFEPVRFKENTHPQLYVEPKGHGILAYYGGEKQPARRGLLIYSFAGHADDPEGKGAGEEIGYELIPLYETLWPLARKGAGETFGATHPYAKLNVSAFQTKGEPLKRLIELGTVGSAFKGSVGAPNAARPPWGWFDRNEPEQPLGGWFFDPAATVKRHFGAGEEFSIVYLHAPFLGIFRN